MLYFVGTRKVYLATLNYLGVQKQVVWHHHSPQHAHHHQYAALRQRWHDHGLGHLAPMCVGQGKCVQKRETYERHKGYDAALHPFVRIGEQQHTASERGYGGPHNEGQAEEHLQRNGRA